MFLNAGCDQVCDNTPGSYRCECHKGYTLVRRMGGGLPLAGTAAVSTAAAAAASVAAASLLLLPLLLPLLLAAMRLSFPSPNAHLNQARSPTCGAAWRPGCPRHVHPILSERSLRH